MKIHIMGASCAGSTTLGTALAEQLRWTLLDTDNYFWHQSEIPFTIRRDPQERNSMMEDDMRKNENAIVSGSVINWGTEWIDKFDLVVFLYIPREIRMERLMQREIKRYGDKLTIDPVIIESHKKFLDWAYGYDDNTTTGRNLKAHKDWLAKLTCPLLEIEGDTKVEERIKLVLDKIK
jgi:adenylate kinase family enzyme